LLKRLSVELKPDNRRVICFPYYHTVEEEIQKSVVRIYNSTRSLGKVLIHDTHKEMMDEFSFRHKNYGRILENTFRHIEKYIPGQPTDLEKNYRELLASYFLKEYSVEAAALFNPSMVIHPRQDKSDKLKILMSLRAAGEQHISSIEFAEGYINKNNQMELLERGIGCIMPEAGSVNIEKSVLEFAEDIPLNQQVIFPLTPDESNGIEDVRFVRFKDDDETISYYGTFTAYNGREIKSKLISTTDFRNYTIRSMKGKAIRDKGMALFPRKIANKYVMISRQDGDNIRLMYSGDILTWESSKIIQTPEFAWQFAKIGNCGSPIELDEGWLLLVHGVGPVRKYVMGAYLLDKNDPAIILKRTKKPMLQATGGEREGYVPNVVYSCGGICHNSNLFLPFAISDFASGVVTVPVKDLLKMME